jgi:general secretion pathway protein G
MKAPSFRYSNKGFSLLELIIVIGIISVLIGAILSRVPFYQEQAEKVAMEQVAGALQSALVMRYGSLLARSAAGEQELKALTTDNPINWLQKKPRNYVGEYFDPAPQAISPGAWFFDLKSRDLVYALDHAEYFKPGKDDMKWIRFHARLGYEQAIGRRDSGKEVVATLFEPVEPYHWME